MKNEDSALRFLRILLEKENETKFYFFLSLFFFLLLAVLISHLHFPRRSIFFMYIAKLMNSPSKSIVLLSYAVIDATPALKRSVPFLSFLPSSACSQLREQIRTDITVIGETLLKHFGDRDPRNSDCCNQMYASHPFLSALGFNFAPNVQ